MLEERLEKPNGLMASIKASSFPTFWHKNGPLGFAHKFVLESGIETH